MFLSLRVQPAVLHSLRRPWCFSACGRLSGEDKSTSRDSKQRIREHRGRGTDTRRLCRAWSQRSGSSRVSDACCDIDASQLVPRCSLGPRSSDVRRFPPLSRLRGRLQEAHAAPHSAPLVVTAPLFIFVDARRSCGSRQCSGSPSPFAVPGRLPPRRLPIPVPPLCAERACRWNAASRATATHTRIKNS